MQRFAQTREVLGTRVEIVVYAEGASEALALFDLAFDECIRVENLYSRFKKGNYLDALNSSLGEKMKVSEEMYFLLKFGDEMFKKTGGIFDLRVKEVLENLGYDSDYSFEKKEVVLSQQKAESGIELFDDNFIRITQQIELGGLGKGYVLDLVKGLFVDVENFCVNAGGDIYARGKDLDIGAWKTVFENPFDVNEAIGMVEVNDFFLASSSANRRQWKGGHHLIDPRKNEPAAEMTAVYIQAASGIGADAYSTALFVMGFEAARENIKKLPVEAMVISKEGEIFVSEGFKGEIFLSEG